MVDEFLVEELVQFKMGDKYISVNDINDFDEKVILRARYLKEVYHLLSNKKEFDAIQDGTCFTCESKRLDQASFEGTLASRVRKADQE